MSKQGLDKWKKALITLPDQAFFALIRHYLGPFPTPFNKQQLIETLISKESSTPVIQRRNQLLTAEDCDLLAAIQFLEEPTAQELGVFLDRPLSWLNLRLLNLEERLWIFSYQTTKGNAIELTPLTEADEIQVRIKPERLFQGIAEELSEKKPYDIDAQFLGLYAFLNQVSLEKTVSGGWKKRPRQEYLDRFSALAEDGADLLLKAAENLGLIVWDEGKSRLTQSYWEDWGTLSSQDRLSLAICALGPWKLAVLNQVSKSFYSFSQNLTGKAFEWKVLHRFGAYTGFGKSREEREMLFKSWVKAAILLPGKQEGTWKLNLPEIRTNNELCVIQANFEWHYTSGVDWAQAFPVVQFSKLIQFDHFVNFELTKDLIQKAWTHLNPLQSIETLTAGRVSQNVKVSIQEWGNQARSVRLIRGMILTCKSEKIDLIKHAPAFEKAVLENIAPGVWIVDPDKLDELSEQFQALGLAELPAPETLDPPRSDGKPWSFTHWQSLPVQLLNLQTDFHPSECPVEENLAQDLLASWQQEIESSKRPEEEKEELLGRLRRRLVSSSEQLTYPVVRGERLEAKGLDYIGKLRLIEQALASALDTLEILTRDNQGHPTTYTVRPLKMEKQGTEMVLTVENLEVPENLRFYVSRLTLVRRLRGSLFS